MKKTMKKLKNEKEMDFNKLVNDIILAARKDPGIYPDYKEDENIKVITTLKFEVTVSRYSLQQYQSSPKNSTRLVSFTIND